MQFLRVVLVSLLFVSSVWATGYKIDPDHSTVGFKVAHLAISSVTGKFLNFSGSINFDPENIASSSTEAQIVAKSVDTNQTKRDDHLRSPEFLDAQKYQELSFKSKEIKDITATSFKVLGDLTIRGVKKAVTLDVNYTGSAKDPWGNERAAFNATTKIRRKDFGLTWNKLLEAGGLVVGEEVTINLEIEGIKQS